MCVPACVRACVRGCVGAWVALGACICVCVLVRGGVVDMCYRLKNFLHVFFSLTNNCSFNYVSLQHRVTLTCPDNRELNIDSAQFYKKQ